MGALLLIPGFIALIGGGNALVTGAAGIARKLRIPPMAVALTLVAFGTSAPEWVVSLVAAGTGQTDMIFGNVIGSNVINIALILGIAAIIRVLPAKTHTVWIEIPFAILSGLLLLILSRDRLLEHGSVDVIGRIDGIVLLLFFAVFLAYVASMLVSGTAHEEPDSTAEKRLFASVLRVVIGIPLLIVGGRVVVQSASEIATAFGLSERVIGATIVAAGTSLPELVTSVVAAGKGHTDIAVGNIVGSNVFNTFLILGSAAVIRPIPLPTGATTDLAINFALAALLFSFTLTGRGRNIERWEGILLLGCFITYEVFLLV